MHLKADQIYSILHRQLRHDESTRGERNAVSRFEFAIKRRLLLNAGRKQDRFRGEYLCLQRGIPHLRYHQCVSYALMTTRKKRMSSPTREKTRTDPLVILMRASDVPLRALVLQEASARPASINGDNIFFRVDHSA
jgi:hypothetical protein